MAEVQPDILPVTARLLPLVQHLRYRVYVAEMGFAMAGADPVSRRLIDPNDGLGQSHAMFMGDELAASVQLIPLNDAVVDGPFAALDLRRKLGGEVAGVSMVSKLVSDRRWRGQATLAPLLKFAFETMIAGGTRRIVIFAETKMVSFYSAMGFVEREKGLQVAPYGEVSFMVFDMADPRHAAGETLAGWMFKGQFQG